MRRLLVPVAAAVIAAVLMLALVPLDRVPAPILRWISGGQGSTALMLEGGWRVDLDVRDDDVAGDLEDAGFELRGAMPGVIVADIATGDPTVHLRRIGEPEVLAPGQILERRLLASGRYWPYELAVVELPLDLDLGPRADYLYLDTRNLATEPVSDAAVKEVRHEGTTVVVELERADDLARLEPKRANQAVAIIVRGLHEVVEIRALGHVAGDTLRFPSLIDYPIDMVARRVVPAATITRVRPIERSATESQAAQARLWLAGVVGLLIFGVLAVARRRLSSFRSLVSRDDDNGGRGRVIAALGASAIVIAVSLLAGERGPFMSAVEAGLLSDSAPTTALDLGYTALMAGFVAAMIASLIRPRWRRDVVCDGDGGRRLLRRGLALAGIAGVVVIAAPLFNAHVNVLYQSVPVSSAIGSATVAVGLVAALLVIGSRALGGPFVITAAAVLVSTNLALVRHLEWLAVGPTGVDGGTAIAAVAVAVAAIAAITAVVLTHRFGDDVAPLRAPIGGLLPASIGAGFALLVVIHYFWGWRAPGRDLGIRLAIVVPVLIAAALFELRVRRGLGGVRVSGLERLGRRGELAAVAVSVAFVTALIGAETLAGYLGIPALAVLAALSTAALMDLVAELRARWRRPTLTGVWHVHQPQLAGLVERALESRGVAVFCRGRYLRSCLGIFGAFIPITAMVDRDRADEARHLIRSVLG